MADGAKFVFFGTPEFAAIVLEKLIAAGFFPAAVVCNPDRPVGRKKIVTPPPVKTRILNLESGIKNRIAILQPENLIDSKFQILDSKPDFAIVAAYAKIIPQELLGLFPKGVLGVHPSLLPKHRGASPIQSAILNGDEETGVTLYMLDEKMDHGQIVSSVKCQASSADTYETLLKKLAELGGGLLAKTLPNLLAGKIRPVPQDEKLATYTKKFKTEDGLISSEDLERALAGDENLAQSIDRKIRAFNPEPGAWTIISGKRTKLLAAQIQGGKLILRQIQTEGERPKKV
ncbi:MAG: methionyl-tRNA formyltransferase [bacterium]|nr:methionyl-tRNA formyltransferase [bacterium]